MTHRWLGLALYAEGPSDHRFLDELLRRTVEHLLVDAGHAVDLSPVQRLPVTTCESERGVRIAAGAEGCKEPFICCSYTPTVPATRSVPDASAFSRE